MVAQTLGDQIMKRQQACQSHQDGDIDGDTAQSWDGSGVDPACVIRSIQPAKSHTGNAHERREHQRGHQGNDEESNVGVHEGVSLNCAVDDNSCDSERPTQSENVRRYCATARPRSKRLSNKVRALWPIFATTSLFAAQSDKV